MANEEAQKKGIEPAIILLIFTKTEKSKVDFAGGKRTVQRLSKFVALLGSRQTLEHAAGYFERPQPVFFQLTIWNDYNGCCKCGRIYAGNLDLRVQSQVSFFAR